MLYLPITRSWICSRSAKRVYFWCALANIYLFAVLIGARIAFEVSTKQVKSADAANVLVRALLWPGVLGTALLAVAMWYFWFTFDPSHAMTKAFWLPVLFLSLTLGPLLYYFFSYRKRVDVGGDDRASFVPSGGPVHPGS